MICIQIINESVTLQPSNKKVIIGPKNLDRKLYVRFKLRVILAFGDSYKSGGKRWHLMNNMAKTPKDLRPKWTEPYSKQETSTRKMPEETMQAAWKDITERLQRMERKEVQHAPEMKALQEQRLNTKQGNSRPRKMYLTTTRIS